MAAEPQILLRRIRGPSGLMWRVAYRFSAAEPWRHVAGPGNRLLRFTSERIARCAARYLAAKSGD